MIVSNYENVRCFCILLNLIFAAVCLFLIWILALVFVFASFRYQVTPCR